MLHIQRQRHQRSVTSNISIHLQFQCYADWLLLVGQLPMHAQMNHNCCLAALASPLLSNVSYFRSLMHYMHCMRSLCHNFLADVLAT